MTPDELIKLQSPLSMESPCGVNMEYDARFVDMQRLAEGTREQQYGDTIVAAHPPDWRAIGQVARKLICETRDLRIAVLLTEFNTHDHGLVGLADGLQIVQSWVCDLWDSVFPQLDETDQNDPFIRINSLSRLCEPERLIAMIGKIPLVEAPPHVVVTLDDVRFSGSDALSSRLDRPSPMEIEAAFLAISLGELRFRYETSRRAETALVETIRFLECVGGPGVWDATKLLERIRNCTELLKHQLRNRLSVSDTVVASVAAENDGLDSPALGAESSAGGRMVVHRRDDAAQLIETAIEYFERSEPSSPVPLLLRRAKKMINQDFVDILRDLAPDALSQARYLSGDLDD